MGKHIVLAAILVLVISACNSLPPRGISVEPGEMQQQKVAQARKAYVNALLEAFKDNDIPLDERQEYGIALVREGNPTGLAAIAAELKQVDPWSQLNWADMIQKALADEKLVRDALNSKDKDVRATGMMIAAVVDYRDLLDEAAKREQEPSLKQAMLNIDAMLRDYSALPAILKNATSSDEQKAILARHALGEYVGESDEMTPDAFRRRLLEIADQVNPAPPAKSIERSSALDDEGAAVVKRFYELLLQKDEPTKKQQDEIFNAATGIETRFIMTGKGKAGDPMIIECCRKNKDLFLPRNARPQDANNIAITSTFNIVQSVKGKVTQVPKEGNGYVMALFSDGTKTPEKTRRHIVVFMLVNGKIDPADIYLDGFSGREMRDVFIDEAPLTEEQEMKMMQEEEKARDKIMSDGAVH